MSGHAFLRLDHLMQPLLPRPVGQDPPGRLVDDLHLVVADEVVDVALEHVRGDQRLGSQLLAPARAAKHPGQRLRGSGQLLLALRREPDVALAAFDREVLTLLQRPHHCERRLVHLLLRRLVGPSGDDERRTRLVDQHAVGLVDDGEEEAAEDQPARPALGPGDALDRELDAVHLRAERDPVAQVVEGELLVRAIGDVAAVRRAPGRRLLAIHHHAHRQPEHLVDGCHPFGVARREVVVHGNDVDRQPGHGRGAGGQRRGEGLPLPRLHLRDHSVQDDPAAADLRIEVAHADRAPGDLADQREALRHGRDAEPVAPEHEPQLGRGLLDAGITELLRFLRELPHRLDDRRVECLARLQPPRDRRDQPVRDAVDDSGPLERLLRVGRSRGERRERELRH